MQTEKIFSDIYPSVSHVIHKYVNLYQLGPDVSGLCALVVAIVQHAPIKVKRRCNHDEYLIFKIFLYTTWQLCHSLSMFPSQ
jgi:hypothetical protein